MKNTIVKDALILTVITLAAGFLLAAVQGITAAPIAEQEALAKEKAYKAVFADAAGFEQISEVDEKLEAQLDSEGYPAQTINEVMQAKDASGNVLGYVFSVTTSEGYGGDIKFAMGVREDGTLNGISILAISETAGLGAKADTDAFKDQFKEKNAEKIEYTKNGAAAENQIDALSGATITTNAVTNGVNAGLCAFRYEKGGNEQ